MFPHMQKNKALQTMKEVYGTYENFTLYAHYSRFKRITQVCSDPRASIVTVTSLVGITARTAEKYIGTSRGQAKLAIDIIDQDIKKTSNIPLN